MSYRRLTLKKSITLINFSTLFAFFSFDPPSALQFAQFLWLDAWASGARRTANKSLSSLSRPFLACCCYFYDLSGKVRSQ
ncbi:hypothetical protein BX600DRAFT_446725 [Xylariales sp. PMI_506]|nr:hypothetical protein BX600DRAFT_446725 [Xylariales sp. PMI_506]